ncbi:hypothetical protein F4825DRAFT_441765 [Nemania diffusa]|nr:hypothetical protein F4825DRAFT_441765 [Nemania diffusa]
MAGITHTQRELGWNVRFFVGSGFNPSSFAGFYQQDNYLTVGQVCRDFDLCFIPLTAPTAGWTRALVPRNAGPLILFDVDAISKFPTPLAGECNDYYYVFHNPACDDRAKQHDLNSDCVISADRPQQRLDSRYLPIGYEPSEGVLRTVPLRGKKRPRTPSPSRSLSPNKNPEDVEDDFPESIISEEEARPIINDFRRTILTAGQTKCAVSRKGGAWWPGGGLSMGIVMEAAHIVPQIHWSKYPAQDQSIASLDDTAALKDAWEATWHMSNGLLLSVQIHRLFDARLISIDPTTQCIRVFMPCDFLTEYHGKKALLPPDVSNSALRHHYDMCCIENMTAKRRATTTIASLRRNSKTKLSAATNPSIPRKDPSKPQFPTRESKSRDENTERGPDECQDTDLPLSPPSSEPGSQRLWRCGGLLFTSEQEVDLMRQKGWLVYEVRDRDNDGEEREEGEEEVRGRPRKRLCRAGS